jgi:hypothetical protein
VFAMNARHWTLGWVVVVVVTVVEPTQAEEEEEQLEREEQAAQMQAEMALAMVLEELQTGRAAMGKVAMVMVLMGAVLQVEEEEQVVVVRMPSHRVQEHPHLRAALITLRQQHSEGKAERMMVLQQ